MIRSGDGSWRNSLGTIKNNAVLAIFILMLAIFNWMCEAQKFRILIRSALKLSWFKSFLTILAGMSVSNFTPARTGEYIGRSLTLPSVHPVKVIIATVTGNLAQVMVTYGLGIVGLLALLFSKTTGGYFNVSEYTAIAFGLLLLIILIVIFGKRIALLIQKRLPKKIRQTLSIVEHYNRQLFVKVLSIATLRYAVFSIQLFLLLYMFSDGTLPLSTLVFVPVTYLLQSLVPVPAVSDIGVRVAVSSWLFSDYLSTIQITEAVTILWFLNLIVPGIIGTIYLFLSSFSKK
jgi:hypothetical protein